MKKNILTILLLFLAAASLPAQDTLRLELSDAIRMAVDGSIDAKTAENRMRRAYWAYRTYQREMLPELSLGANLPTYSKSMNLYQNDDGTYKYVSSNSTRFSGGLSLNQNIPWTGGTVSMSTDLERLRQPGGKSFQTNPMSISLRQPLLGFNALRWARKTEPLKYSIARKDAVAEQEEIALTVIARFFNLLAEEINLQITRQNMEDAQRLYTITEARNRMGQVPDIEVMDMQSSVLSAEIALTNGQYSFDNQMFSLRSYLGLRENTVIVPVIPEFPSDRLPNFDYEQVLAMARENSSFTEGIQTTLLNAEAAVRQAKANRRGIDLTASFGLSGDGDDLRTTYRSDRWENSQRVQVGISMPILDWGRGKGRVRMAEADREIVEAQVERENLDFSQRIFLAVQNYNNQPRQLEMAGIADRIAQQRYKASLELYMLGKLDILKLNDAEAGKDGARRSYIQQVSRLWSYYYEIRALTLYDFIEQRPLEILYDFKR